MANENKRSSFDKLTTFVNLNHIPGPRGLDYFKYVKMFQADILDAFTSVNRDYGAIGSFPWPMNSVIIYCPKLIKEVLNEKNRDFIKGEQIEELKAVVGNGLATNNDHESWLHSRKLMAKEFNNKSVAQYLETFEELTKEQLRSWGAERDQKEIDVCREMKFLTFKIASKTILGGELSQETAEAVDKAVTFTSIVTYKRIFEFFPTPYWVPTPKNFKFNHCFKTLNKVVNELIESTRQSQKRDSVLEKLVFASDDETGYSFSKAQLRDEVLTLMLAGHETTAHSLTWTLGLLAKHQEVQQQVFEEVLHDSGKNNEETPILNAVIQEAMRLYPPFPVLSRKAKIDTQIGEYFLPKETNVVIPIFVTQRNDSEWEQAMEFDYTRFLPSDSLRSYKHLPFGKGPRRCIAELFALQEMRVILMTILKEYSLELTDFGFPKETAFVSLKPIGGMPLRLVKR